jgi:hypothetical protein
MSLVWSIQVYELPQTRFNVSTGGLRLNSLSGLGDCPDLTRVT